MAEPQETTRLAEHRAIVYCARNLRRWGYALTPAGKVALRVLGPSVDAADEAVLIEAHDRALASGGHR